MIDIKEFDRELLLKLYKTMVLIRLFEKKIEYGFSRNQIHGTTHLCIGQEGTAVGVCSHLRDTDYAVSTHRGHGHSIGKGLEPLPLMAEVMGKQGGYCKGKGGTQHVAFLKKGFLGTNGITGGGLPIATGAAFTIKQKKRDDISVSFFGDGAVAQGTFHESLNMASLWNLPVLFVCENNMYGMSTHVSKTVSGGSIAERGAAYGIESISLDGMNVLEVYEKTGELIKKMRGGGGPKLIECHTYRYSGHSKSDMRIYRTREEENEYKKKCPIKRLQKEMIEAGVETEEKFVTIQKEISITMTDVYQEALDMPFPDTSEALKEIFFE